LAVMLMGPNPLNSSLTTLYLRGVEDKTVHFRVGTAKERVALPTGNYALSSGAASYGTSEVHDWEVSFTQGPCAEVKAGEVVELALGKPTLSVRAIEEKDRYNAQAVAMTTFKKGTRIYLEPKIVGEGQEVFSRFRQPTVANDQKADRPPKVTITASNGKRLLAATMEYG